MNAIALTRVHTRIALVDLLRSLGYVIPTIGFPTLFYVIFDLQYASKSPQAADILTLSFMAWAVIGVCLYQFGVGIAYDRGRPWERYVRTLPAEVGVRFAARILTAMAFGILSAACVAIVARIFTPIDLNALQWLGVLASLSLGGVPFVFMGITLGYWASARAAVPIATTVNLLLAYAGGLWAPPQELWSAVQQISPYLPTRQLGELLWSIPLGGNATPWVAGLAVYTAVFGLLAATGYRRDERKRYA